MSGKKTDARRVTTGVQSEMLRGAVDPARTLLLGNERHVNANYLIITRSQVSLCVNCEFLLFPVGGWRVWRGIVSNDERIVSSAFPVFDRCMRLMQVKGPCSIVDLVILRPHAGESS